MNLQTATIPRVPKILKGIATLTPGAWATFYDVAWDEYEELLEELSDSPGKRVYYDKGTLEIMLVSFGHERRKESLASMVYVLAEESEREFIGAGSTTIKLKSLRKGADPGTCFFLGNVEQMLDKDTYDLRHDPPPDLVIEVDITRPSHSKLNIYAKLGVAEFWRYADSRLEIFKLIDGEYIGRDASLAFRFVRAEELSKFLADYLNKGHLAANRAFRDFVKSRLQAL